MTSKAAFAAVSFLLATSPALASGQEVVKRPALAQGTVLVPDQFLRRWDPVTVFFDRDRGPATPGPEDQPERFVTLEPAHPGAFRWLDARTLQFRPAEPWPALRRFAWTADGRTVALATLLSAPAETVPKDGQEDLDPVETISLSFPEPLDEAALAQMVSVELRPLPGVGSGSSRWLTGDDFQIKTEERRSRADRATYVLGLSTPIPLGTRAVVHLRLSLDDSARSFKEIGFATAQPFRVLAMGCRERRYPVTPEGTRYSREQALSCGSERRAMVVELSAAPRELGAVEARNLLKLTPAVEKLSFEMEGRTLEVAGDFAWDTLYQVALAPTSITDVKGRPLEILGPSELFLYFPRKPAYVRWTTGQGFVERYGPKMVPVEGRGQERVDVRVQAVAPLDRSLWPFPAGPVIVDESKRPPGPGEEPAPHIDPDRPAGQAELAAQISTLGSPPVSTLVPLPLHHDGGATSFGLDLSQLLERVAGRDRPGTYLVGLRDLAGEGKRAWMRLQVTDLSLTTVEEPHAVRFVVTALSTGRPVAGARVRIEGAESQGAMRVWATFGEGTTDPEGSFLWPAPGYSQHLQRRVKRLVVEKDDDVLVLDPTQPPDRFANNQWSSDRETWLQWTVAPLEGRGVLPQMLCHIFTERPVYRPEEEVHIKGYLRNRDSGRLEPVGLEGWVVVEGPGELSWKYPVTVSEQGSFYHRFSEPDLPTGTYSAHLEDQRRQFRWGHVSFQLEAYRIPRFEVRLHGPDQTSLDRPFEVSLTAAYYAGGKVGGQPVSWRVTQFPLTWGPQQRTGFYYSSDSRFSTGGPFRSTPRLEREEETDEAGAAVLALDPTVEPTAQPRQYVVEATVTGPDDQTVTATRSIRALPAFVLGLKVPRFLERARQVTPELIAVGPDDELIRDLPVTVRLLRREWHSHLRASDFSDGVARYVTDVVDQKVREQQVRTGAEAVAVPLALDGAGVYIVEIEAHDRLDRAQVVRIDLYAGGDEPVTWSRPATRVFSVSTDKADYDPGDTAALVLESPFQSARVLAVIEAPDGNRYQWLDVKGGAATLRLPVLGNWVPRLPVHFVLMRGRIQGTGPVPGSITDLGKPATLAATTWIKVNPVAHRVEVALEHPASALPGQTIDVTVTLKDPSGRPLAGEVTLWLVDAAVLALGTEQRLDPVPTFIPATGTHIAAHDTRNLAFGVLPLVELPGGGVGEEETGLLDRATVRRDFRSVPYYEPAIRVGPDGRVTVKVKLPDNLTVFKLRAKVASGKERFGFAKGQIAVRLPLIVQPALPRFVRPGDRFQAAAIGRIVEGRGGPGAAEVRVEGVRLEGAARREVTWVEGTPQRLSFPVEVETPGYDTQGALARQEVTFRIGVERASDGASDAFEVRLPIRADRERVTRRVLQELAPGATLPIEAVTAATRPGTLARSLLVSSEPALVRMASGLDFLLDYPYGCTEQQVSRARAYLALRRFRDLLKQRGSEEALQRAVRDTLQWISASIDPDGLVAYWPGARGYVSLTAWVAEFMIEAREAGFTVDEAVLERLLTSLEQALRSDYSRFIDGESYLERAWALSALAQAGRFNAAYAAELARRAQFLDTEGLAQVLFAFARAGETSAATDRLLQELWEDVVFRLHQGREIYAGLRTTASARNRLVLPSETRAVAEATRALVRLDPKQPRVPVLVNGLVTLGRDDGWGDTNANAAALLALAERLSPASGTPGQARSTATLRFAGREEALLLGPSSPLRYQALSGLGSGQLSLAPGAAGPVLARVETSYVPAPDGSQVSAEGHGFVVTRELLRVGGEDEPLGRLPLDEAGTTQAFAVGDVVEEHVVVVCPKQRHYVAVTVPLAAGMEPLNPNLATAPPEARPRGSQTLEPTYVAHLDDSVSFYYDSLPAGTYHFYFRTRATIPGTFIQPAAKAAMMYDGAVFATSNGARIEIAAVAQE